MISHKAARSPAVSPGAPFTADTAFFVLTADAVPPEMGIIVRVKVPLSILAGVPSTAVAVGVEPAEVEADVLVGQDGRPHAIRFVSQTPPIGGK